MAGLPTRVIRELEPRAPSEINEPRPRRVRGNLADYLNGATGAALAHVSPGSSGSTDATAMTRT